MPYIDKIYYENEFMGKMLTDENELNRTFAKASEAIDILTGFKIQNDIDEYLPHIKNNVKKATAMMAEHYILNGGYDEVNSNNLQSVSVVSFSYSVDNSKVVEVPQNVYKVLFYTGLLYSGVHLH